MPVRNTMRVHSPDTFYHVYNRGIEGRQIFCDDEDYDFFVRLFARHLSLEQQIASDGTAYKHFRGLLDINAYCLMPNHFHIFVYLREDTSALSRLMASITVAYSMYFNKKYKRRGPLFETRFKASPIFEDVYLQHISRYIHLNPGKYKTWPYSSYGAYISGRYPLWLQPEAVVELFDSVRHYEDFVADYESVQRLNELLKHGLADS